MHQTLYIDIDEEITSVVERLKKAQASEIIMVVPKRALLIQSIVNLRILKKEAESRGLQLMIVTQDKLGKLLIEKAGILVQQKLDETMEEELSSSPERFMDTSSEERFTVGKTTRDDFSSGKRLERIGSSNYMDEKANAAAIETQKTKLIKENKGIEPIVNKELVTGVGQDIKKKPLDMGSNVNPDRTDRLPERPTGYYSQTPAAKPDPYAAREKRWPNQNEKIEQFFHPAQYNTSRPEKRESIDLDEDKKTGWGILKKVILVVIILAILVGGATAAYMYVPKASINLILKQKSAAQDYSIKGQKDASLDVQNEIIPIQVLTISDQMTKDYSPAGAATKTTSGQKAQGTITIYNTFSASPQPLVATTRFLSDGGKLFRLVGDVIVPGTTTSNGQVQPGTVDAQVIADQPGADLNIGPAKFTIPGFQTSSPQKYAKIYGQSAGAMTGGGSGNDNSANANATSPAAAIKDSDIARAKTDVASSLADDIKQKLKSQSQDLIVMDDAINVGDATYKSSKSIGQVTNDFQMTASAQGTALAFREDDLKNLISQLMSKSAGVNIKSSDISLDYGQLISDFKANTLQINVHAATKISSSIDMNKFKKDILGKTNDEFESYLSSYPDISKAEISYWPPLPFFNFRIPRYASRIYISITYQSS